jgi:acetyl esterase/lipase
MASEAHQRIAEMLRSQRAALAAHADAPFDIDALRKGMELMTAAAPLPEGTRTSAVDAGGIPCEWIELEGAEPDRAILYLHGGGYTMGSIATHRALVARLSGASGMRALAVDYRLAPEHPFPAAVEDATAAYRWLVASGVSPERIAIGGDSAGGGLCLATLIALRDGGDPLPAAGFALSPWVDLEGTGDSARTKSAVDPMVDRESLARMGRLYLDGADPRTPLAAPLYAELAGLPRMLVQVGTAEVLLDDATRIVERARSAGVEIELDPWEDLIHVFQAFAPFVPEAQQAIDRVGAFLREAV